VIAKELGTVLRSTDGRLFPMKLRPGMEVLIIALALATLAGCSATAPVSIAGQPTATQPPPSSAFVEPTPTPAGENRFSIHLLAHNVPPHQLAILSHLELEKDPLLSIEDIASYNKATHEIELTGTGYERIHALSVPTNGKAFAVCVGGQPVYAGAFWVAYSSLSFDGIVIDVTRATKENPVLQIQLGYPGPTFFYGDDPRSDPRIFQALERAGKLK